MFQPKSSSLLRTTTSNSLQLVLIYELQVYEARNSYAKARLASIAMIAKRPDQDDHGREQASAAGAAVLLAHNRKNEHSSNTLEIYRIEISDPRRPFSIGRPIDHGKQQRRARNNGGCTPHGRRGSMGFVFFLEYARSVLLY